MISRLGYIAPLVVLIGVALLVDAQAREHTPGVTRTAADTKSFVCPITESETGTVSNSVLEGVARGRLVIKPGGEGHTYSDGSWGMKFGWNRLRPGRLTIEGRRLDDSAPPLRAKIPEGFGDIGFQPSTVIFPTPGCWEVVGRVGDGSLTIVVLVERIGDGPSRQRSQ